MSLDPIPFFSISSTLPSPPLVVLAERTHRRLRRRIGTNDAAASTATAIATRADIRHDARATPLPMVAAVAALRISGSSCRCRAAGLLLPGYGGGSDRPPSARIRQRERPVRLFFCVIHFFGFLFLHAAHVSSRMQKSLFSQTFSCRWARPSACKKIRSDNLQKFFF